MIETDLRTALLAESSISTIIGTRMFLRKPLKKQTETYLEYSRDLKTRDMVSESNRFKIFAFSKDMVELETLATNVINFLENKKVLNNNSYFSISLDNQTDGSTKLEDGFYWNSLTFTFKNTT
jgi:hypothetical protein